MDKNFVLIIEYLSGSCAFLTNHDDLILALKEFQEEYMSRFNSGALQDKGLALPKIVSARVVRKYYSTPMV